MRLRVLVAGCLVCAVVSKACLAENTEPLELRPVFSDDFVRNTRSDYDIRGPVSWEPGRLRLAEGASIERSVKGGAWANIVLDLRGRTTNKAPSKSELRGWFILDGASHCYVRLRMASRDNGWTGSVALVDTGEKNGQLNEQVVRELPISDAANDKLLLAYRDGLVSVAVGSRPVFLAYIKKKAASVAGARIQAVSGDWDLTTYSASCTERLAEFSAEQQKDFARAEAANGELIRLYKNGEFAKAVELGKQIVEIRKELLGQQHADYARSLNNLGRLYQRLGDRARARQLYEQATESFRKALGHQHPDYAVSLDNLAQVYYGERDYAHTEPLYKQVLDIRKSVLGELHPDYAYSLNNLASLYYQMGEKARAEPLFKQAVEVARRTVGERHPDYATSLFKLGTLYLTMNEYVRAEPLYQQAVEIRRSALGERHADYAQALSFFAGLSEDMGNYVRARSLLEQLVDIRKSVLGERHPDYVAALNNLAGVHFHMGDYVRAEPLYQQALDTLRSELGEQHPDYATALGNLGVLYKSMGDFARAEPLYQQALDISQSVHGEQHVEYIRSLNNLASLYANMGDYARAQPRLKQVLETWKIELGEKHPDYLSALSNLAVLYASMGDYARAEPIQKQVLEIRKSVQGEQHPDYVATLVNYASLYMRMGDSARAEPLLRRATDLARVALGEQHPLYANSLTNLAALLSSKGDFDGAEPLCIKALDTQKTVLGEQHPDYVGSLGNLASLYYGRGDLARAESLYKQSAEGYRETLGEMNPGYATSLENLALLYQSTGDYARAEPLYEQARDIRQSVLGEQHPDYATSLHNLALLHYSQGDNNRAEPLLKQASSIVRESLDESSIVQSERQQRRHQSEERRFLDSRIANLCRVAAATPTDIGDLLGDHWRWKGAVSARQQAYRQVASNPKLAKLFEELQLVSRQLSALSSRVPVPPSQTAVETNQESYARKRRLWEQQFAKLSRKREELEQQIAADSDEFRRIREPLTVAAVQQWLPAGTALVDFLEYQHGTPNQEKKGGMGFEHRYVAFVVTKDRPVLMIQLGSAEMLSEAIATFRRSFLLGQNTLPNQEAAMKAGQQIRQSLWLAIEPHLNRIDTVVISPDTVLGTLPFAALPGRKPGSYLLEDYRIAMLPMASQLRALVESKSARTSNRGLLVLGDVDYDTPNSSDPESREVMQLADAGDYADVNRLRNGRSRQWSSLPGFRRELDAVRELYRLSFGDQSVSTLTGNDASEDEFLALARRYGVLHLVTHGYFEDPDVKSISQTEVKSDSAALSARGVDPFFNTWMPGLLSGLVMAGANGSGDGSNNLNDGILSASEIEASSLQGVDLVVLSACETGLGAVAGGEGLTGLQRAFQIAGAKSVVASLWKVEDRATQELMERFYQNLWKKQMSKVDALREAQLWLLRHPVELESMGVRNVTRGMPRNLKPTARDAAKQTGRRRTDPYFWAAFQLSGDWR